MKPRRLHLDYVAGPRRQPLAGLLLLAVAIATAAALVERHHVVRLELDRIEASRGLVIAERRPAAVPRESLQEQAKSAEAVVRQLALPWQAIIETVETTATPDVAILQMQPEAQQRLLRLSGEARTQEAMLDYVRALAAARTLAEVHVVNHQVRTDNPQRPIQFTVQASFRGLP